MSTLTDKARLARKLALAGLAASQSAPERLRLSHQPERLTFVSSRRPVEPEVMDVAVLRRILPRPVAPRRMPGLDLLESAGLWASYGARLQ